MKRFLSLATTLLFSVFVSSQSTAFQWAKQFGGHSGDGNSIAVDRSGNVYTTGIFKDTCDFDPGVGSYDLYTTPFVYQDIFISKLDGSGNFVWAHRIGGTSQYEQANAIAVDSAGNVFVTGSFRGTVDFDPGSGIYNLSAGSPDGVFILKLDTNGNFVWTKYIGGAAQGYSIVTDSSGNVFTTGHFYGTMDFDPGIGVFNLTSGSIFVLKLDNSGNFVWAKGVGPFGGQPTSVTLDITGNICVTGTFYGTGDFNPGTGVFNLTDHGSTDVFILKLDTIGNFVWAKGFGSSGPSGTNVKSIATDPSGSVYITGWYFYSTAGTDFDPGSGIFNMPIYGSADLYILKLDFNGNFMWATHIGSPTATTCNVYGHAIVADQYSDVYISGVFDHTVDFDPGAGSVNLTATASAFDTYILKLNSFGNFMWVNRLGGAGSITAWNMCLDPTGNIYGTGHFIGTIDYDPNIGVDNMTASSGGTVFVYKIGQVPLGIGEQNYVAPFSLFPNPTSTNLTIEITKPTSISIVNLLGQELFNSKVEKSQTIDVSFLSNGIYFVKDLQNGGSIKFVKQ